MSTLPKHTISPAATPDPRAPWPSPRGRLLKSSEARNILSIGNTTFWKLVSDGDLRMVKLGQGQARVDGDSLADLMAGRSARGATASAATTTGN